MFYRTRLVVLSLVIVGAALWASGIHAQAIPFSVQMAGSDAVQAMCAAARFGDNFSGVNLGACQIQPPPVNDPNALNNIIGKYTSHACTNFATTTGQDFASTFGHPTPPYNVWPYAPSTGVSMTLPAHGRYYGGVINSGLNPGILPHYLKGDPYAGSCNPPLRPPVGARVSVRVVPVGNTPAPTGLCSKPVAAFDASPWIQLKFAGPPNTAHCLGVIGGNYRYVIENAGTTNILSLITWN